MKTILKLSLTVLLLTLLASCSTSDDNTNEIEAQLLGKWFFENPLAFGLEINNSFTFSPDGTVTYSFWTGGADFDFDSEEGTYNFNDDIMTMVFPDNVALTFVQRVVFLGDNIIEFQNTGNQGENAWEGDYFRDGVSDFNTIPTLKEYQLRFTGHSSSSQQYPINIEYYSGNENGQTSTEIVNSQTSTDVIESINLESVDKIGFKYDVSGYEDTIVNFVEIKDVESNTVIFTTSSLSIEDNQTFTYDISDDSYTIQ